jgi:alanyl-tRNA synthetase
MTDRLYLEDPYVTTFDARVVERRETKEGRAVVLDATYFYPESGGQPFDLGTIQDIPVERVVENGPTILHFVERFPEPDRVHCVVDSERRRDHMQQHSGQHILSAAFLKELDAQTISFHLGSVRSTIDLDREGLSPMDVQRVEKTANEAVSAAKAIHSTFVDSSEARDLTLRKAAPETHLDKLRIVAIEGFDQQACCGTHPRSSAEVGPIVVRGFESYKSGTRVTFLCGERVFRDYHESIGNLRAVAAELSSGESELASTVGRLRDERKALAKENEALRRDLLTAEAEAWAESPERIGTFDCIVKVLKGIGPADLRPIANSLVAPGGRVVLLASEVDERAHLVFARSQDVDVDVGKLLQSSLEPLQGRGGGSRSFAQGGGPKLDALEAAMELARNKLAEH